MKRLVKTVLLGLVASAATASWAADHYWYGKSTSDVTQAEWNNGIGTWSSDVYFITEKDLKDGAASVTTLDFSQIDQDTVVKKFCVANGLDDERVVTFTGGAKFGELHVGYWGSYAEYSGRLVLDGAYTTGYLEMGPWLNQSYAITGMVEVARSSSLAVNGETRMGTSTQGVGVLVVKGDMDFNGTLTAGYAAGGKGVVEIAGGTVYSTRDPKVGMLGAGTLTVDSGGAFWSGAGFGSRVWTQIATDAGSTGTINLNAGGEMYASQINKGDGSAYVNFNGGRLTVIYGGDTLLTSGIVATVGAQGGTIDTAGYSTTIATEISGEGTLTITGRGRVAFNAKPTCAVEIENGTAVFTAATTPGSVALGTGGFVEYDLSGETEAGKTVVLGENVAMTTSDESPVAEHVIIRNNGELYWNVSYGDGSLSATSFAATNGVVTDPTGDFTIFTGYYNGDYRQDQVKSWVNGFPTADTKVIVPSSIPKMQIYVDKATVPCKELVLNGDFAVHGVGKWCNFRPNTVTGNGTLTFSARADAYGYFEAHKGSYACTVDVPVVLAGPARVSSYPGYLLTFNKSVTFAAGATVNNNAEAAPVFNGDVTVESGARWICSLGTVIASGKTLSGSGTIEGPIELNGIVAPGTNTAEILTVTGAATFNSGSSLLVTIGEDGASSRLVLTGEGTVDVSNISVDVANKSALHHRSGCEYTIMTVANGSIVGKVAGTVTADDGSVWKAKIFSDAKSLVLVQSFGGLAVFVR